MCNFVVNFNKFEFYLNFKLRWSWLSPSSLDQLRNLKSNENFERRGARGLYFN